MNFVKNHPLKNFEISLFEKQAKIYTYINFKDNYKEEVKIFIESLLND